MLSPDVRPLSLPERSGVFSRRLDGVVGPRRFHKERNKNETALFALRARTQPRTAFRQRGRNSYPSEKSMSQNPSPDEIDRLVGACLATDQAFFVSETKWGVGRLERLVKHATREAYRRGWAAYDAAIREYDAAAVEEIGAKMVVALAFMDREAEAAGEKPLAPDVWEARLTDGTVFAVVRTEAEQSAVLRASKASDGLSGETTLPPDLAVAIRETHEGRLLDVWTMAQLARLVEKYGSAVDRSKWEGAPVQKTRQGEEGAAADWCRGGGVEKSLKDLGF
jgi:hypothetical protein